MGEKINTSRKSIAGAVEKRDAAFIEKVAGDSIYNMCSSFSYGDCSDIHKLGGPAPYEPDNLYGALNAVMRLNKIEEIRWTSPDEDHLFTWWTFPLPVPKPDPNNPGS